MIHLVWGILLNNEDFVDAYEFGKVQRCADGIKRLFFLRINSKMMDYPEQYVRYLFVIHDHNALQNVNFRPNGLQSAPVSSVLGKEGHASEHWSPTRHGKEGESKDGTP